MRSSGKEFGDAGRLEPSFGEAHGSSQARTTGTDHYGIVFVVYNRIIADDIGRQAPLGNAGSGLASASSQTGREHVVVVVVVVVVLSVLASRKS
jgi:hypothetical protein